MTTINHSNSNQSSFSFPSWDRDYQSPINYYSRPDQPSPERSLLSQLVLDNSECQTEGRSYIPYVPYICLLNAGVCGCYYGISSILFVYFLDKIILPVELSSALPSAFFFVTYAFALVGGIVADALTGPFMVLVIGSFGMLSGILVLINTELLSYLNLDAYVPMSFTGLTIFFLSNGFMKPCLSAFMGDQFSKNEAEERTKWFSWFYLTIQFGSTIFSVGIPLLFDHFKKTWYTFTILLVPLLVGFSAFIIPSKSYRKKGQKDKNVFLTFIKIIGVGCTGHRHPSHRHWLDKAKESGYNSSEVEDTKVALKVLFIMIPLPFFWMIFFQMYSIWLVQAKMMNLTIGTFTLPASITSSFNGILDIAIIPLFEKIVYPLMSYRSIERYFKFTPLKRMGAGLIFTIVAMCVGGIVTKVASENPGTISIALIIPQYVLISCAEILLSITGLEFAYKESPESMKGTMTAIFLCTTALGNVLIFGFALIQKIIDLWKLDFVLAGIVVIVLLVFIAISSKYTYKVQNI